MENNTVLQRDPDMVRCRKCHKWFKKSEARSSSRENIGYDKEIDWEFSETVTRVYCPYCGHWHR